MGILGRLFKVGQSEANAMVDKLEDPVKMVEQGVRDLKKDLGMAIEALGSAKAGAIQARKEYENSVRQVTQYAESAEKLLPDLAKQELATRALGEARRIKESLPILKKSMDVQEQNAQGLEKKITSLRDTVAQYERDLVTLKARAKAAAATEKINKQLSQVDSSSTIAMLERMKQRVDEKEASAEAFGEIADNIASAKSLEEELRASLPPPNMGGGDLKSQIEALKRELA